MGTVATLPAREKSFLDTAKGFGAWATDLPRVLLLMIVVGFYAQDKWLDAHMDVGHKLSAISNLVPVYENGVLTIPKQYPIIPVRMGLYWRTATGSGYSTVPLTSMTITEDSWSAPIPAPPAGAWMQVYIDAEDGTDLYGKWFRP